MAPTTNKQPNPSAEKKRTCNAPKSVTGETTRGQLRKKLFAPTPGAESSTSNETGVDLINQLPNEVTDNIIDKNLSKICF